MTETDGTTEGEFVLGEDEFAAIMASVDAAETSGARRRRAPFVAPDVGSDGEGKWFLAAGTALNGTVTRVEGKKVYGRHSGPCGRCGGRGGSDRWPGFTCFACGGATSKTDEVRLYDADEVAAIAESKGRRTERKVAERAERHRVMVETASGSADEFRAARPDLFRRIADHGLTDDPFVAELLWKLDAYGDLSEGQLAALERAVERRRASDADKANSDWRWTPGDRVETTVTWRNSFVGSFSINGHLRSSEKHVSADDAGNVVVFRTQEMLGAKKGDRITLKGTVKEHAEYRGVRQTVLNRVKVTLHVRKADLEAMANPSATEEEAPAGPAP